MSAGTMPDGNGDCFVVAYRLLTDEFADDPSARLVHGIALGTGGPAEGVRFWHAWVERDEVMLASGEGDAAVPVVVRVAVDRANGNDACLPAAFYRHIGSVRVAYEYCVTDARVHALVTGVYGPWVDD